MSGRGPLGDQMWEASIQALEDHGDDVPARTLDIIVRACAKEARRSILDIVGDEPPPLATDLQT